MLVSRTLLAEDYRITRQTHLSKQPTTHTLKNQDVSSAFWRTQLTAAMHQVQIQFLLPRPMTWVWGWDYLFDWPMEDRKACPEAFLALLYHNFTTLISESLPLGEKHFYFSPAVNWTSTSKVSFREGMVQGFSLAHKNAESHTERVMKNIFTGRRLVSLQA